MNAESFYYTIITVINMLSILPRSYTVLQRAWHLNHGSGTYNNGG